MRLFHILFSLAAILMLLLAACSPVEPGPSETSTSPAGTVAPIEETEVAVEPTEPEEIEEPTEASTPQETDAVEETEPAEETGTPDTGTGGAGGEGSEAAPLLTDVMDYPVRFANSSIRGSIVDAVVDLNAEQLKYLLVNISSAAAGGDRVVPIPWSALELDRENNNFSLGFNLVTATDAPTVDLEAGIDFSDPEWDAEIQAYWANQPAPGGAGEMGTGTPGATETETTGTPEAGDAEATATPATGGETATPEAGTPTATQGIGGELTTGTPGATEGTEEPGAGEGTPRYILASGLLDASVHFSTGAAPAAEGTPEVTTSAPATLGPALGRVEDLVLDADTGAIVSALTSPSDSLGLEGDVWVPVPVSLFSAGPRPGTLVLNITQEALDIQSLPVIDPNQLPDFSQLDWQEQLDAFWQSLTP